LGTLLFFSTLKAVIQKITAFNFFKCASYVLHTSIFRRPKSKAKTNSLQHDSFYDSIQWRLISRTFKRNNPFCYYCSVKENPIITIGFICDHLLPRRFFPELEFTESNFRNSCRSCDQKKRQIEGTCSSREDCQVKLKHYLV
jgi:5-methylcytosine-specific restriction endonuclease McrA